MVSQILNLLLYFALVVVYLEITIFMKKLFLSMLVNHLEVYMPTPAQTKYGIALAFCWPISFFIVTILWLSVEIFKVVNR
jgi:hypothetical protein